MSGLQFSINPLLEPLGFIKVLEWIFSIFSFATCGGYSGKTSFIVGCPINTTLEQNFEYPFRLNTVLLSNTHAPLCNTSWDGLHLIGDYSSSSQFYVVVAVFAFLYCLGALVLYLGYMHLYRQTGKLPMIDFVVTMVFAFLWLVSASAWATGLTNVKSATNPDFIIESVKANCTTHCYPGTGPSMGSLNVSVVFGFLNLILWAGNAWFVFKETRLELEPPSEFPQTEAPRNAPSPSAM